MKKSNNKSPYSPSCIYGLGMIGAAVYFISMANGFAEGTLGVLKAIVWPAILVYKLFVHLAI
ncbi:MAG: hypothetical protein COA58_01270 [Bacteroidetes bacterium]|nr:MAG: hypothetical protein COA58_01270 [Bacteroidota bacterium]